MVQYGVKTRTQWAADLGHTYEELVDQAAAEVEHLQAVSTERKIPIELLSSALANPTETLANMAKAAAGISDEPEPPPGMFSVIGDKGAKGVIDLLAGVGKGEIDRDSARMTLVEVYGMEWATALAVLPDLPAA